MGHNFQTSPVHPCDDDQRQVLEEMHQPCAASFMSPSHRLVTGEEGTSFEKMLLLDWAVGMPVVHLLVWRLM